MFALLGKLSRARLSCVKFRAPKSFLEECHRLPRDGCQQLALADLLADEMNDGPPPTQRRIPT
jgi:hypothetical protein